jgi:hypothetical protein
MSRYREMKVPNKSFHRSFVPGISGLRSEKTKNSLEFHIQEVL